MSGYGDIFTPVTITGFDDVAATTSVQALSDETDAAFTKVEDVLGNVHGLNTSEPEIKTTSVGASLGDIEGFSPEKPFNVMFSSYVQTFNDPFKKEFVLDLIANTSNSIVISSSSDPSITWNLVADQTQMGDVGDYAIVGKSLFFYKQPSGQFTITYDGNFPEHDGGLYDGYKPNVYPSPALLADSPSVKPTVTQISSTRYKVDFVKSTKNNELEVFGSQLTLTFNPVLSTYVSNSSFIPAPLDFVSIWIKPQSGTQFRKLDCSAIYLVSDTELEFDSTETFSYTNDTLILVVSNISISDSIKSLTKLLFRHAHDRYGMTEQVSHASLKDLIPVSDKSSVIYGGSKIRGNDHPQYLNREGYNVDDPGTYGNSMLGDIFLASTNSGSDFNNIAADSNRLIFGSISNGTSIRYNTTFGGLLLFGAGSGLKIQSLMTSSAGKQSTTLDINGHQFFNYNVGGVGYLSIGSTNNKIRMSNNAGNLLADVTVGSLTTVDETVSGDLVITDPGSLTIGGITLEKTNVSGNTGILIPAVGSSIIDVKTPVSFALSNHIIANITTGNISTVLNVLFGAKIAFGGTSDQALNFINTVDLTNGSVTERTVSISTQFPFRFFNTGRRSGISFGDTILNEYANLYTSSPNGDDSTPSISDAYMELHLGSLYLLKTTNQDIVGSGRLYKWQTGSSDERIDSLQSWPRANLFAAQGTFTDVVVDLSSITEKKGVAFGENNHIYVTGPGTACPQGWMVLESQNGVVLVDSSSDPIDCSSLNYSNLSAGDIQSFGSVIAQQDISAGGSIRSATSIIGETLEIHTDASIGGDTTISGVLTLTKDLVSLAGASFNTDVSIKGALNVNNGIVTNGLISNAISTFNEIVRAKSDLYVEGNLFVTGDITGNGQLIINSKATINILNATEANISTLAVAGDAKFNASIETVGGITIGGSLDVSQTINSDSSIFTSGQLSGATLSISGNAQFGSDVNVDGNVTLRGDVTLNDDSSKFFVAPDTQFGGQVIFNDQVNVYGDILLSGTVTAHSDVNISAKLNVDGISTFNSTVTVNSSLNVTQVITSTFGITTQGKLQGQSLEIVSQSTFGSDATFSGAVVMKGDVSITDSGSKLNVASDIIVTGAATFNSDFNAFGDSVFSGSLTVNALTALKSTLTVDGVATFNSSTTVKGSLTTESLTVNTNANVTGNSTINGNLLVQGTISNIGGIQSQGDITGVDLIMSGDITAGSQSSSSFHDISLSGNFNQVSTDTTFEVSGVATFKSATTFQREILSIDNLTVGTVSPIILGANGSITLGQTGSGTGDNIDWTGNLFANVITCNEIVIRKKVTVIGDSTFTGNVSINGNLDMENHNINNVKDPVQDQDAATKKFVLDAISARAGVSGVPKWVTPVEVGNTTTSSDKNVWKSVDIAPFLGTGNTAVAAIVYLRAYQQGDGKNTDVVFYFNNSALDDSGQMAVFHDSGGGNNTGPGSGAQVTVPVVGGNLLYYKVAADPNHSAGQLILNGYI